MPNTEYLKIPRERVGVLIGKEGDTKEHIENMTGVHLDIESDTGSITIVPTEKMEDPLSVWKARYIVKAIGRGFSPETALKLLDDEYILEIINLPDFVGKSKKAVMRQKGRIIGREGRTKEIIKEMTDVDISVYGKTVSLIGDMERIQVAKEAVQMILDGVRHKSVYAFLEKKKNELKRKEFENIVLKE
ncbi:MAG: KH domain-containing protein [Methanobacterium sp.]